MLYAVFEKVLKVRLTAGGKTLTQPLTLKLDPRVRVPESDIVKQVELASAMAAQMDRTADALSELRALRKETETAKQRAGGNTVAAQAVAAFDKRAAEIETGLRRVSARFASLFSALSSGDAAPTAQAVAESEELAKALARRVAEWNALRTDELSALNEQLRSAGIPPIGLTGRAAPG